jgi:glycosyltransferase involved in cell wall biosynthesis
MTAARAPLFSVIVPTRNRPGLLSEALASVRDQTLADWELIVVDDGSTPPVDEAALRNLLGARVTLLRHATSRGVAAARNSGYARARGQYVAQLDDDDLLAPDALARIAHLAGTETPPDVVFIGVHAFGSEAADVNARQQDTLARTLTRAGGRDREDCLHFGEDLFGALLHGVPAAFQHAAFRRELLQRMTPMRSDHWPESAWAIEAAARALRCVLIPAPLYRWRRDGQSYFSLASMAQRAMDDNVAMKHDLLTTLGPLLPGPRRRALQHAYGEALFDRCHGRVMQGLRADWRDVLASALIRPGFRHIRLLARMAGTGHHGDTA